MAQYGSVITTQGNNAIVNALSGGAPLSFSHFALGDGNGGVIVPVATQNQLVREVWRGPVTQVGRDNNVSSQLIVQAILPASAGPFTIREAGIILTSGVLFAITSYPATIKDLPASGITMSTKLQFLVNVAPSIEANVSVVYDTQVSMPDFLRAPFISVESITLNTPPVAPVAGQIYVPSIGATGAWATMPDKFTQWNGTTWIATDIPHMTVVGVIDESAYYRRDAGIWVPFVTSAAPSISQGAPI